MTLLTLPCLTALSPAQRKSAKTGNDEDRDERFGRVHRTGTGTGGRVKDGQNQRHHR